MAFHYRWREWEIFLRLGILSPCCPLLWIAFKKIVSLHAKQPRQSNRRNQHRCESLSKKLYLCMLNNRSERVNAAEELWIAFKKIVSLHAKQPASKYVGREDCCESLSKKLYLCMLNNQTESGSKTSYSCESLSKKLYLCMLNNWYSKRWSQQLLWIAFKKIVSLHAKQQCMCEWDLQLRCESLSKKLYLCMLNNSYRPDNQPGCVVNRFQKNCIFAC